MKSVNDRKAINQISTGDPHPWVKEFPARLVVIDRNNTIIDLTEQAARVLSPGGSPELLGRSVLDCHPEQARAKLLELIQERKTNIYTYTREGQKYLVVQAPWTISGEFAGYFDLTIKLPANLPHFDRDLK
ncbi:MAG: PAS domain-containing protein [Candidatus Saccharicenans sp.]|jgi:transcriptional regulator with PAS, ATPase and Fis domain|nr:PAS domain-containing protein [Candidatus Saccharicenans sp.]MDH7575212.1 PAS domain-containing protein [Candidatus Saccharicenans sp.]